MQLAERLSKIPPYLFMELRQKVGKARAAGVDVISLGVGDPVEPTPEGIIEELSRQARNAANHQYPPDEEKGMGPFRQAVADFYRARYGVSLDPATEVLALIGSKEGIHHFCLARVNPGDVVLMTDPGYPAYRASILMAGGEPHSIPILPEGGYLPKLSDIPSDLARKASALFLCYPNNPTGALATKAFYADLARWAKDYDVAICQDGAYSEMVFDPADRVSFLQAPGAMDVGVELGSLSKSYNMTGWRLGMVMGNRDLIAGISKVKENTDSGVFAAIQHAGIRAIQAENGNIDKMLGIYRKRQQLVVDTFNGLGWSFQPPKGTFYLWLPTPKGMSSIEFTNLLFDKAQVVVAAGTAYGKFGEGFVRLSLAVPDGRLAEAMERIKKALAK
ncbi:MAG: aminotransferase class I/II-fold pyridoxal phosphate-dependent enzyme [Candidatus Latescibacteria bacterium]|nr:aminotransferase class I/II-fold pyridoxal phosphate-dependent enzyme [Candidatus Latescibacterota bacterium]